MNAKLPIALGLVAVLLLPVLAELDSRRDGQLVDAQGAISSAPAPATRLSLSAVETTQTTGLPTRGMTMAQVEQSHGAPAARRAPVGDPPITRWEYPGFVVYFEYRHVIHSVTKVSR